MNTTNARAAPRPAACGPEGEGWTATPRECRIPPAFSGKLVCCLGQFPEHLDFPDASFDGIYCARLFHFFTGDRIRIGMLARELARAGLRVVAAGLSPYTGAFASGRLDGREIAGAIGLKA
jgi:SAM-dependent methyltransferase